MHQKWGYEITTQQTTATQTSDLWKYFYILSLEHIHKVVDLSAEKLLNEMTLIDIRWWTSLYILGKLRTINLFVFGVVRSFTEGLENM